MPGPLTFGPLEKEVLEILWQFESGCCVRDIYCTLNARRVIAYTTVMTVMNRLVEKGALQRHRQGKAHSYTALLSKQDVLRLQVRDFFANLNQQEELASQALQQEFALLSNKQQLVILKALVQDSA